MILRSGFRYILILIRLIITFVITVVTIMFILFFIQKGIPDAHVAMQIFYALIILAGIVSIVYEWTTYRHFFPKITITEKGIQKTPFFGLGFTTFYEWKELSGYDTGSFTVVMSASFSIVKIFKGKSSVLRLDESVHDNFDELRTEVEKHLEWYPNGHKEIENN